MNKLIHKSYIGCNGDSIIRQEPMQDTAMATIVAVSWNYMHFLMFSCIFLPHMHAFKVEPKLSLNKIMSAAAFATSDPLIPNANPTSAFLREGTSFTPSPMHATTPPSSFSPVINICLSSGLALESILNDLAISLKASRFLTPSLIEDRQTQGDYCLHSLQYTPPTI
jgi:hypothetical protein